MNPTSEFQPLIDDIFREKVLRARATPPTERFMEGFELFEWSMTIMRDGVRAQHPQFTPDEIEKEINRRFAAVRRIEEQNIYRSVS